MALQFPTQCLKRPAQRIGFAFQSKPSEARCVYQYLAGEPGSHDGTGETHREREPATMEITNVRNGPRMASIGRQSRFAARGASGIAWGIARPWRITGIAPSSREDAGVRCLGERRRCAAIDESREGAARSEKHAESRTICGRHLMEDLAAKQECPSAFDVHHRPSTEII